MARGKAKNRINIDPNAYVKDKKISTNITVVFSNNKKKRLEAPTTSPVNATGQGTLKTQLKDDES